MESRTPNEQLISAVIKSDFLAAKKAIEKGADVRLLIDVSKCLGEDITNIFDTRGTCYNNYSLLYEVKTKEILYLLLDNGANPNCFLKSSNGEPDISLLEYWMRTALFRSRWQDNRFFDLVAALANYRPCYIPNTEINKVLLVLLNELCHIDEDQIKTVKVLCCASIDLQEKIHIKLLKTQIKNSTSILDKNYGIMDFIVDTRDYYFNPQSPFSFGCKYIHIMRYMLENNFQIWKAIASENFDKSLIETNRRWKEVFENLALTKLFNQYAVLWLALRADENSDLYSPIEILYNIIIKLAHVTDSATLAPYQDQLTRNLALKSQKIAFEKIYRILNEYTPGYHGFVTKYKNEPECIFFAEASKAAAAATESTNVVTRDSLNLSIKYHNKLTDEKLVNTLTDLCVKHKIFFFTSREKEASIREEIKIDISKKL